MKYVIIAVLVGISVLAYVYRRVVEKDVYSVEAALKLALADVKREALAYKVKLTGFAFRLEDAAKKDEKAVVDEAKKIAAEIRNLF